MFSKTAIRRPVTTMMVLLIVMLGGVIALSSLKLDLMPKMDIPLAVVSTTYIGAGPEEIASLITKPLEEALGTVPNIDEISSTSSSNSSMVMLQFQDGTDIDMAAIDIREKVDMVKGTLPEDANEPMVLKMDMAMMSSIIVGVSSDTYDLKQLFTLLEDSVSNRIERIEGVASVEIVGGVENEVEIVVDPVKMQGYGVNENQLKQSLSAENLNYPTGQVQQGETKLQVRSVGQFKSIDEIRNLPITTSGGAIIYVKDFAQVNEVEKDMGSYALIDGKPSVMLVIQKQSTANVVDISEKVNKELDKIRTDYPNLTIDMLSDTAEYITSSINNILSTAVQAAIMAVIVLFIFLRDPKSSLIIGISIPTSIVATFALMYMSGMTMNMISMGGLTMGIGMLVDNSVVVLDNIFKYWKNGMDGKRAAEKGSSEVAMAVTASTLTTVAVFFPLMFASGIVGQLFKDLSLTITYSLVCSLVVSLSFVPMACSKMLRYVENRSANKKRGLFTRILDLWGKGVESLDRGYQKVLKYSLVRKKRVVLFFFLAFVATLMLIPNIGIDFMPAMDQGVAQISVKMPKGIMIEETQKTVVDVFDRLEGIPETKIIYSTVGGGFSMGGSTDSASITVNLVGMKERSRSTDEVVVEIKERLKDIAGAEITVSASSSAMGSFGGAPISVQLNGDDSKTLRKVGEDIMLQMEGINGMTDIASSVGDSIPEAVIRIKRDVASSYGISSSQIAGAVSTAITGSVVTKYKTGGTEIDIRIRQPKDSMKYIADIRDIKITAPTGAIVPLSEVADIEMDESSVSITRISQHQYITLSADAKGMPINVMQEELKKILDKYPFPEGYSYEFTGTMESMTESYSSLMLAFVVAVLLVYMIMASQFESLIHPFIVMFSVPLAITGGILGLFITGKTITITAFMGFIMLSGTVVNNAIVLVDYTNQLIEKKGMGTYDALVEAGPSRLQPILMTTLTTALGLVPMALGIGEGMEMQQPLAITVIFGLSISTIVTLVFIPVLYAIVDKLRYKHIKNKRDRKKKRDSREDIIDQSV